MVELNAKIRQHPAPPTPPPPPPQSQLHKKLPSPEFLSDDRRIDFNEICVRLCKASIKGDWKTAEIIIQLTPELLYSSITERCETALHVAALGESTTFVNNLVNMMEVEHLLLQTKTGDTALCLAAAAGNVKMAKIMVAKNKNLLTIRGSEGLVPLCVAAFYGNADMVRYLYKKSNRMEGSEWKASTKQWLLLKCVEFDLFDAALKILENHSDLAQNGTILGVLAQKPYAFYEPQTHNIWRIIKSSICLKVGADVGESQALQVLRMIWTRVVERPKSEVDNILRGPGTVINGRVTYSSHILFVAAEMGNTDFVLELISKYPDLIWKKNENKQSIFHIAVSHRNEGIYKLLYEIGSMKDIITRLTDTDRNNMLHLVGKNRVKNRLEDVSGVAFQMQRELQWFKEVESMIPPFYRKEKNNDGLTPLELFTKSHKDLVSKGEKWMKGTASQCMVVAALIATIVFAVAFTIPGGYNQSDGFPMFRKNGVFIAFVIVDAISLILSSTSILVFLSILTSRYAQQDFLKSLPKKLLIGLGTLFLSIMTMMVAFSISFFLLYEEKLITVAIPISVFAFIPIISYATLHYHLLMDSFHSTISSRHLFKPQRRLFSYENPRL
ncbi:unnamed protein product [Lactuca saligna]|uniref:PGG domain-containing protein n=1 Tax=Lactuca saligna TaxID=75948 RepID=A0AA35YCH0_LACSI|nr:unnamed protein product [Lactuca saligna]